MIWPLEQTFRLVRPSVPAALVTPDAWASVFDAARRLPQAISCTYLECRLDPDGNEVDLGASVTALAGRPILQASGPVTQQPLEGPGQAEEPAAWRRVQDLARAWADPASPMHSRVPVVWLELDSDALTAGQLLPSVLVCMDPSLPEGSSIQPNEVGHGARDCEPALDAAISALFRESLAPQTRASLLRCFEELPEGGRVAHVGFMVTRRPAALKLFVSIHKDQVLSYLQAVGWPGSLAEAAVLLATFGSGPDTFRIDLTIGPDVRSSLGLEFASRRGADPDRRALIDLCVERGLCSRDKRDGLVSWPGSTRMELPGHVWPVRLSRWIDMKIVHRPPKPLEAKAYLGFMMHFSLF